MINDSVKNCSHLAFITFEYYLISITFNNINYNKTFISTIAISFVFILVAGLLFFVSAISHQTFAQDTLTIKETIEKLFPNENEEPGSQTVVNETSSIVQQEKHEQVGGSTLEEQLKLAQEKLNQLGLGFISDMVVNR